MSLADAKRALSKMNWSGNANGLKNDFNFLAASGYESPQNVEVFSERLEILQRQGAIAESVRGPTDWKSVMRKHREVLNISLDPPETERILLKTKKFVNACLQCCKEKI
jgi:hypothetical protein